MFLDASALVAIFNREEDGADWEQRLALLQSGLVISPMVKFEACLAIARSAWERTGGKGKTRSELLVEARTYVERYLATLGAREIAITAEIGNAAIDAAATYGKVVGHKAALNMGDCFSYACAKVQGLPLLYKGNDFSKTDLS
jgi:ribonuclease VapC